MAAEVEIKIIRVGYDGIHCGSCRNVATLPIAVLTVGAKQSGMVALLHDYI